MQFVDGFEEFGGRRSLEQVAACAGAQGFKNLFGLVVSGEHHDGQTGHAAAQLANAFDAAAFRQFNVHQHHVRAGLGNAGQGLLGRAVGPHTPKLRVALKHSGEPRAKAVVVFDHRNFYWRDAGGCHG